MQNLDKQSDTFIINDEKTWPSDIIEYLENNYSILCRRMTHNKTYLESITLAPLFDKVIYGLRDILNKYFLHGYHCTRLTEKEISFIYAKGMSLPNQHLLKNRIQELRKNNVVSSEIATRLLTKNEAHEEYRAGMIWFCFFHPYLEFGTERLFRSWGGEALYNSHENDPKTGPILRKIGTACIIQAKVPIAILSSNSLSLKIAGRFSFNRDISKDAPGEYEDCAKSPISSDNIIEITKFPEERFFTLTKGNLNSPIDFN